jgi:hypothetical protein
MPAADCFNAMQAHGTSELQAAEHKAAAAAAATTAAAEDAASATTRVSKLEAANNTVNLRRLDVAINGVAGEAEAAGAALVASLRQDLAGMADCFNAMQAHGTSELQAAEHNAAAAAAATTAAVEEAASATSRVSTLEAANNTLKQRLARGEMWDKLVGFIEDMGAFESIGLWFPGNAAAEGLSEAQFSEIACLVNNIDEASAKVVWDEHCTEVAVLHQEQVASELNAPTLAEKDRVIADLQASVAQLQLDRADRPEMQPAVEAHQQQNDFTGPYRPLATHHPHHHSKPSRKTVAELIPDVELKAELAAHGGKADFESFKIELKLDPLVLVKLIGQLCSSAYIHRNQDEYDSQDTVDALKSQLTKIDSKLDRLLAVGGGTGLQAFQDGRALWDVVAANLETARQRGENMTADGQQQLRKETERSYHLGREEFSRRWSLEERRSTHPKNHRRGRWRSRPGSCSANCACTATRPRPSPLPANRF